MIAPDRIFRAFADETRIRILHLLTRGELCVCDLISVIGAPQPKISRHLAYLKRCGLVTDRKEGIWRHYSLNKHASGFQRRLIDCLRLCLDESPVLRKDAKKMDSIKGKKCP